MLFATSKPNNMIENNSGRAQYRTRTAFKGVLKGQGPPAAEATVMPLALRLLTCVSSCRCSTWWCLEVMDSEQMTATKKPYSTPTNTMRKAGRKGGEGGHQRYTVLDRHF